MHQSSRNELVLSKKFLTSKAVELKKFRRRRGWNSFNAIVPRCVLVRSRAVQNASQERKVQYVLKRKCGLSPPGGRKERRRPEKM